MKKILLVAFSLVLVVVLSACGSKDNTNNHPVTDTSNNVNENVETDTNIKVDANTSDNNADNADNADNNQNGNQAKQHEDNDIPTELTELTDFEEAETVDAYIDNLDELQIVVELDIPNKRIILYKDNGSLQYKSIFIKNDQHLKIINTHDEGKPLYNDRIK